MATPMGTPITQLPATPNGIQGNIKHDEDQVVADVIKEMNISKDAQLPLHQPQPQVIQQYMLPQSIPHTYVSSKASLVFGVLDKTLVTRATVAAIVALALFYPETLSNVYSKVPSLGAVFEKYDKVVRALLLMMLLYIIMLKLDI